MSLCGGILGRGPQEPGSDPGLNRAGELGEERENTAPVGEGGGGGADARAPVLSALPLPVGGALRYRVHCPGSSQAWRLIIVTWEHWTPGPPAAEEPWGPVCSCKPVGRLGRPLDRPLSPPLCLVFCAIWLLQGALLLTLQPSRAHFLPGAPSGCKTCLNMGSLGVEAGRLQP